MPIQTVEKPLEQPKTVAASKKMGVRFISWQAKFPLVLRVVALAALILTVAAVAYGYWVSRGHRDFRLKGQQPQLSTHVTAIVDNYERRVMNNDRLQMLVRASRDTTFDDNHHELDNVLLENYPTDAEQPDRITAAKAVYLPNQTDPNIFTVDFTGDVHFESRDGLKTETAEISYNRQDNTAETAALINFSKENISGSAVGATLHLDHKKLELKEKVEINVAPDGKTSKNSLTDFGQSNVKINAARADLNQDLAQFELNGNVLIEISPRDRQQAATTIRAEQAVYQQDKQKLDLNGSVEIVTASDNVRGLTQNKNQTDATLATTGNAAPVTIRSRAATFEQADGKIFLNGAASVEQTGNLMNGDQITADVNKQKKLEKVVTRGNGFLRSAAGERTTEVNAAEMIFQFDQNQQIKTADATGAVKIRSVAGAQTLDFTDANKMRLDFKPLQQQSSLENLRAEGDLKVAVTKPNSADFSQLQLTGKTIDARFAQQNERSAVQEMNVGGRAVVNIAAPAAQKQNPRATDKKLAADSLKLNWNENGQDLRAAAAVGNAEMYATPLGSLPDLDQDSVFAARFDAEFYSTNNLIKTVIAKTKAKAVLEPTVKSSEHQTRTLYGDVLTANFQADQAIENFTANGNAKFNQSDRNGTAADFNYKAADEIVRLRGGEPTVWDNQARVKAMEIDWNTRQNTAFARGRVATTYYTQAQTNGATPFTKTDEPVFIVADHADFKFDQGAAHYTGNAKTWQDTNFVRADNLFLQRDTRSMIGEGAVQSAVYNARKRENNKETVVPVFASAARMTYSDETRQVRYENQVDIRQGTDRIQGGTADVFLDQTNQVSKTIAQNNVVITQPGRRAVGDWAQYTAVDDAVILRGRPANVEDQAQGASSANQLTFFLRENRIEGVSGATPATPGRIRSTHKIRN